MKLFSSAATSLDRAAFMVAYSAGLRVGEVCRLTTDDIDSERQVIHVRGGKGGKDRITLLSPHLLPTLRRYWKEAKLKGRWLFPRQKEEHISPRRLWKGFRKAVAKASISGRVTFHTLVRDPYAGGWGGYPGDSGNVGTQEVEDHLTLHQGQGRPHKVPA